MDMNSTVVFVLSIGISQFAYFFLFEAMTGRTIGKMMTGIEVRRADGSRIDASSSFTRNVWRFVDSIFYYTVGILAILESDEKQRIGDRRARTIVVRR